MKEHRGKMSASSVEMLYEAALHAFSQEQEVGEILVFGSLAQGVHDQYSDVDLCVVSDDFERTMSYLPDILQRIGEVLVLYPLHTARGCAAYMTLFKNYPLYTKLDFNVFAAGTELPFSGARSIYRREGTLAAQQSELVPPMFEQSLHALFDAYLGAVRYTKYRKRGMQLSAYKFYRAQLDRFLLECYQQTTHATEPQRLGILEYQLLDKRSEQERWQRYLYPADEQAMNALYIELLRAAQNGIALDLDKHYTDALTAILDFMKNELNVSCRI